jgi:hypothetical protein
VRMDGAGRSSVLIAVRRLRLPGNLFCSGTRLRDKT